MVPSEVPPVAWAFAWACLAGQVLSLLQGGRQDDNLLIPSMLLGAAVIGWVSYGVLRARTVRVVLVWIVFSIGSLAVVVGFVDDPSGSGLVDLVTTVVPFVLFIKFTRTDYYQWQRTRPREAGPSLTGLVAIAFAVGALGGVIGTQTDGFRAEINAAAYPG